MSEIKLFRIEGQQAQEVSSLKLDLEKSLQTVMEKNLVAMLGVRFLASEYRTGKTHMGRVDTLGLDEDNTPVIIEYKRATNENVINQGLFYLDWLLDHRADFQLLVMKTLGSQVADAIDWTGPRLICIAGDYTTYDLHAVKQIPRNIDLVRHRRFEGNLIALELVHRTSAAELVSADSALPKAAKGGGDKPVSQWLQELESPQRDLFEALRAFLFALGDDVQEKQLKLYLAFRRIKTFASVVIGKKALTLYLRQNPDTVILENGFTRDVRNIGHWATGDLEITLHTMADLYKAEAFIMRAYDES
ncbi:MAG: DUF5655 domain-containing protein [Anaerolineae bacterium]